MIKQLERIVDTVYENGSVLTRPPNNTEIMDKINEIIYVVNKIEKEHNQLVWDSRPNMFSSKTYE